MDRKLWLDFALLLLITVGRYILSHYFLQVDSCCVWILKLIAILHFKSKRPLNSWIIVKKCTTMRIQNFSTFFYISWTCLKKLYGNCDSIIIVFALSCLDIRYISFGMYRQAVFLSETVSNAAGHCLEVLRKITPFIVI